MVSFHSCLYAASTQRPNGTRYFEQFRTKNPGADDPWAIAPVRPWRVLRWVHPQRWGLGGSHEGLWAQLEISYLRYLLFSVLLCSTIILYMIVYGYWIFLLFLLLFTSSIFVPYGTSSGSKSHFERSFFVGKFSSGCLTRVLLYCCWMAKRFCICSFEGWLEERREGIAIR